MARIRTIKPEFPQSESMGRVSRDARLCFIMLWTMADDAGRLRGNSRMLASLLFPYDDDAREGIVMWLGELEREGCVLRYDVGGDTYLKISAWRKHQKIDKPSASKFPAHPHDDDDDSRPFENIREASPLDQGTDQGEEGTGPGSAEPQRDSTPVIVSLPLVDGTEYPITAKTIDDFAAAYPAINVTQQCREMRAWCIANKANRKTTRGVLRFVNGWLAKEQDRAPRVGAPGLASASTVPSDAANKTQAYLAKQFAPLSAEEQEKADKAKDVALQRLGRKVTA